ncbi:MAG TPA: ATP-dependent DNA helicase Rep, partial [Desulfuromonas sp.]|nr:ATP-dependent DNA helicase Rep [Desulfuromonas sp.]
MDLSSLNPEQRAAVRHSEGPLLLLAGAGSGKTRVITFRIAHLVRVKKVPAEQILAMTFTNKAAREMKERVVELVGAKTAANMIISTFHSLGVRLLRQEIERLGYKRTFSILGTADQLRLIRDLLQERTDSGGRKPDAERVQWLISDAKNRLISPAAFAAANSDFNRTLAAQVYPLYQNALKAYNALDFDDIINFTVKILSENPEILEKYQNWFRYIMVDEYQDTNKSQYELSKILSAKHKNICAIGDM